ncbi:hypothetical protein [Amazonocrinis nigriterrae]|uniref:hypothetical protein n=1 Tax=Amazonocrinis nigriterrae TaxID=2840443 RepID=UPI001BE4C5BA|nr:hypothetical protein [Amazonocrinis nigriterrae]
MLFNVSGEYQVEDLERFYSDLKRFTYILKFHDKNVAESWIKQLHAHLKPEYIESCLIAAIFELSITDVDTFHWVLDNLSHWDTYTHLLQEVTKFVVQKLIKEGFIPGQDFSATSEGKILIHENARKVIISDISQSDNLLIKKILLTSPEIHFLTIS